MLYKIKNSEINYVLLIRYINSLKTSKKTIETYSRSLKLFVDWLTARNIKYPKHKDIIEYKNEIKAKCKPTTVQVYIVAIRRFFKWLEREKLYKDVALNIPTPKIDREHKKDPLSTSQIQEILAGIDTSDIQGKRNYAIIALAVTSGVRTIELQRADIADIRTLEDETVLFIQGKGKIDKSEYVKLTAPVERAIRTYLNDRPGAKPSDPLFASVSDRNNGGRLTTKSYSRLIKDAFKRAGYDSDRLTAHSLRHTAATLNVSNGGSINETRKFLRLVSFDTTMVYARFFDPSTGKSEHRISNCVFGASEPPI